MDRTFKGLGEPFRQQGQLMYIHAFIEMNGAHNQFPLVFCLMSRKTKSDYLAVFRSLQSRLGHISIERFVLDFEKAAWIAIREAFPGVELKGCPFHWSQAVWRHVQSRAFVRQVLALQFLPSAHVRQTVQMLQMKATAQATQALIGYLQAWSVYRQKVRTNNDVEGWHHRLNSRALHMGLSFYQLVPLLRREADQRRCFRFEKSLNALWDQYMQHETKTSVLELCRRAVWSQSVSINTVSSSIEF
ncbi:hypothetical protein ACJMK2_040254 [Sinanodonta woodiana]|uniref:MULE transposase domain-containing protein n=1 Tax=Sinanodonta woodiana TaxID=1069815 RepID=A0ABD3WHX2_SINWO